jgi:hypothetical protein
MNRVLRDSNRSSGSGFSVFSSARENNSKALVPERKGTIADKPLSILGLFVFTCSKQLLRLTKMSEGHQKS